ncbi:MAG: flagellar FlbD family protein [Bacillota bacterium]|nr:flagellar FlbD family protein [Bacillota bacterium]
MIKVTRLNGKEFYINCELIEFMEETPDTVISMTTGKKLVVTETTQQVLDLIIAYKRKVGYTLPPVIRAE